MNTLELIEHGQHERQTTKERLDELYQWLLSYTESSLHTDDLFSKSLSLKRTKLDEQIIQFRQFHTQLRTRRHSFDSEIKSTTNVEQLLDPSDRKILHLIDQQFELLDQQANLHNERINRLSTRLNEFHLEHAHLIDDYDKRLRLYREHLEQNDDINFSTLQLLMNDDQEIPIEQTLYQRLIKELLETEHVEDQNEIQHYEQQLKDHRSRYEAFRTHLKAILHQRQDLLNEYETKKNLLHDWLTNTDRTLKQQPNDLTLARCEQLLIEHSTMPIESLKSSNQKLIHFYSSSNLSKLYEQLDLPQTNRQHSNTTAIFQRQTDELIDTYHAMKERLLQHMEVLSKIQKQTEQYQLAKQKAEQMIEKAKELVTLEENTILPLDSGQVELMLQKYKVRAFVQLRASSTIDATEIFHLKRSLSNFVRLDNCRSIQIHVGQHRRLQNQRSDIH